jgi:hypothetical protein
MKRRSVRRNASFTLIEVIVTMLIVTVISALLMGAFHTGLMSYGKVAAQERSSTELAGALSLLKDDLRRFVPLDGPGVCLLDGKFSFYALSHTPSSHLELVSYSVTPSGLERMAEPYLFDDSAGHPGAATILGGVDEWRFSYLDGDGKVSAKTDASGKDRRPAAVLVRGTMEDGRPVLASMMMPVFAAGAEKVSGNTP